MYLLFFFTNQKEQFCFDTEEDPCERSDSYTLSNSPIRLCSGNYIITRRDDYESGLGNNLIPIYLSDTITNNAVIILNEDNITIEGDQETEYTDKLPITPENPIIVPENYNGLFENGGFALSGWLHCGKCNNYQIKNIHIKCQKSNGELGSTSLWQGGICRKYFSLGNHNENNLIENCSFEGKLKSYSGGICGAYLADNGSVRISNCFIKSDSNLSENPRLIGGIVRSASDISYGYGGIVGAQTAYNNGKVIIERCYSTGNINGVMSGGIVGSKSGNNNGRVIIDKCYSTGNITGNYSGGITGSYTGKDNGKIEINFCYSTGEIVGEGSGGICGSITGSNNGKVYINNSFSIGKVNNTLSGGILGLGVGYLHGSVKITNSLYRSIGCSNRKIDITSVTENVTIPSSPIPEEKANINTDLYNSIGSLSKYYKSLIIKNSYYVSNIGEFNDIAKKTIGVGVSDIWYEGCGNGSYWLLQWQFDDGDRCVTLPINLSSYCNDMPCINECKGIGTPNGNCECIKCCKSNDCSNFQKGLIQFLQTGDTLDCDVMI